jgi:hypothetical protein
MAVAAQEEQLGADHPRINVEHLFLALLRIGGPVTDALAAEGVTLAVGRKAVDQTHAQRLASLGISLPGGSDGPRERRQDYLAPLEFDQRAQRLLERAANQAEQDVTLFHTLLDEPSGRVRAVLEVLGVEPANLELAAVAPPPLAEPPPAQADPTQRWYEYRRFVPERPAAVWALVSDPERWLEWNQWEHQKAESTEPGTIRAFTKALGSNGKPVRLKPGLETAIYVVKANEPERLIEWERSWPELRSPVHTHFRIELVPRGSGTEVILKFRADKPKGHFKRLLRFIVRPLIRPSTGFYLRAKAQGISLALSK